LPRSWFQDLGPAGIGGAFLRPRPRLSASETAVAHRLDRSGFRQPPCCHHRVRAV